jgi:hypothetical protein
LISPLACQIAAFGFSSHRWILHAAFVASFIRVASFIFQMLIWHCKWLESDALPFLSFFLDGSHSDPTQQSIKRGGTSYAVPIALSAKRRTQLAIKWLIQACRERKVRAMLFMLSCLHGRVRGRVRVNGRECLYALVGTSNLGGCTVGSGRIAVTLHNSNTAADSITTILRLS